MDITSFLIGLQKGKALGGSAQSPDVKYVTFMNGAEVLYVKPVATGDDCVDVLTKGLISTPTKDPTVSTVYTYSGWSLTDGGAKDSGALTAVTENRTVYAAYTSAVRTYTITYYDSDGVTVLKTESLAYGATPSYTHAKDGFNFDGWVPALDTVTGDASYVAVWTEKTTFAGGSWGDIAAICEAGEATDYFKVGDTKTIEADGKSIELLIVGFNHDDLADGTGKASMTIMMRDVFSDTMPADNWQTLANTMRTVLKPKLPAELQSIIKTVTKPCDVSVVNTADVTPVNVDFDLFPPSYNELKIKAQGGYYDGDGTWNKYFTELGTTYEHFENEYNATNMGPYYDFGEWCYNCTDAWYRQWVRVSTVKGIAVKRSFSTSGTNRYRMYGQSVSNTTNNPVLVFFCI